MFLNKIKCTDCKKFIKSIQNKSVDLIVIDPPYNELPLTWDRFDDWSYLKEQFVRISKKNTQMYIFGKQPMLSKLYHTLQDKFDFRFELIWNKNKGLWNSNYMPMRSHELIWCFKKTEAKVSDLVFDIDSIKRAGEPYVRKNKTVSTTRNGWASNRTICKDGRRFPLSVLNYPAVIKRNAKIKHPTQKPLEILEWIIKSSSKPRQVVLDCFMGSGTTAVACKKLNRIFMGCEINRVFYNIATQRLSANELS